MSVNPAITNSLGETETLAEIFQNELMVAGTSGGNNTPPAVSNFDGTSAFLGAVNTNRGDGFSSFLGQFNSSNPIPTNAQAFLQSYMDYLKKNGLSNTAGVAPTLTGFLNGLASDLTAYTGIGNNNQLIGNFNPSVQKSPTADINAAASWLTGFLQYYNQVYVMSSQSSRGNFQNLMGTLLGVSSVAFSTQGFSGVVAYETSTPGVNSNQNGLGQMLNSYFTLYFAANPSASVTDFNNTFKAFYNNEIQNNGIFIPSESFNDWVTQTINAAKPHDFTSLHAQDADKTAILNSIYALIAEMLNSIQEVAAAQSSRLTLLTNWQQSYSNIIQQVPTFLDSNAPTLGAIRDQLNSVFNNKIIQNLQTQQSLVGDTAKSLQSNINQENDAVSQQANMGTSLIQELNTILSAIFK